MSLNDTASAERIHIAIFGKRNAGKSSLINRITGQALSVISDVPGTTTDPVKKAMELLPLGPVVLIDTPGFDDVGELGSLRVKKTKEILEETDIALLVVDATWGLTREDQTMLALLKERTIPYLIAYNKAELLKKRPPIEERAMYVSAETGEGVPELKERLAAFAPKTKPKYLVSDILEKGDLAVLVIPIDESAPKGRLILPQQQVLRELLDNGCAALSCQPSELKDMLSRLTTPPKIVITDSQVFEEVAGSVPSSIELTSFSILFARYKGELETLLEGANTLKELQDGDRVLIAEGCTHHRQCNDIGTVKLPGWIEHYTGKKPIYSFVSGNEFPEDLTAYRLVVHCGGCMLTQTQMESRIRRAKEQKTPIVNYGVAIAAMHGILERSTAPFFQKRS